MKMACEEMRSAYSSSMLKVKNHVYMHSHIYECGFMVVYDSFGLNINMHIA